jgi:glutamate--cysteine ligase
MAINLNNIPVHNFRGSHTGLEKEGLRVTSSGYIAASPHPRGLGAPLTHPHITTDFAEAQMELITAAHRESERTLQQLYDLHAFVQQRLQDESLWPFSMPCRINSEQDIQIAQYGSSTTGMTKTIYRRGLAHRYGKSMQVIAGLHYNFSFSNALLETLYQGKSRRIVFEGFKNDCYLSTIRNIQRFDWLLLYLFGASPVIDRSFPCDRQQFQGIRKETLYQPYATSLRMSDIGYTNRSASYHHQPVNYNSLSEYVRSLDRLVQTPSPAYASIPDYIDGEQQQLSANELQLENEHYTSVRPKQMPVATESSLQALQRRGIRYIEIRSLDIDPFSPVGISIEQMHFLETFMHYCLLFESPASNAEQHRINRYNLDLTASFGRDPSLQLVAGRNMTALNNWARDIFEEMKPIAEHLDQSHSTSRYSGALQQYERMLFDPDLTPSARILNNLKSQQLEFSELGMQQAQVFKQLHTWQPLNSQRNDYLTSITRQSLSALTQIEHKERQSAEHASGIPTCPVDGESSVRYL